MLVDVNLKLLDDAACVVSSLHDRTYTEPTLGGQRVGAQLRHVIEFYESFLDGLTGPSIDYDARKRDVSIEQSRSAALARIESLKRRLSVLEWGDGDIPLRVVAEDAPEYSMWSTVCRELQALRSHTIHHFAVIAMALHAWGIAVDPDFGVAPSTLATRAASKAA
jgi:hypothetical protein